MDMNINRILCTSSPVAIEHTLQLAVYYVLYTEPRHNIKDIFYSTWDWNRDSVQLRITR